MRYAIVRVPYSQIDPIVLKTEVHYTRVDLATFQKSISRHTSDQGVEFDMSANVALPNTTAVCQESSLKSADLAICERPAGGGSIAAAAL